MANELYDGTRVFTAAAGANALAADQNTIQDQLILGLEARRRPISLASGLLGDATGWVLDWTIGNQPDITWTVTNTSSSEILFPVDLREGEYVEECEAVVESTNGQNPTGGSIVLYSQLLNAGTTVNTISDFGCGVNFWDTDAAGATKYTDLAVNHTVDGDYFYFIGVQGATGGMGACVSKLHSLCITTRFHYGA